MSWLVLAAVLGLIAAAAVDLKTGRIPNPLVGIAFACAVLAFPEPSALAGAGLASAPLLALASLRLIGMGDVKLSVPIGVLLAGQVGVVAIAWWWVWSLLGAALLQTVGGAIPARLQPSFASPTPGEARRATPVGAPLAPVLLLAAVLGLLSG